MKMQILPQYSIKEARALNAGELIVFDLGGTPTKAISMAPETDETITPVAVLSSMYANSDPHPFIYRMPFSDNVLSFGTDWTLDLNVIGRSPGNSNGSDPIGTIVGMPSDIVLKLAPLSGNRPAGGPRLSLLSFEFVTVAAHEANCVAFSEWKIWAPSADRERIGAVPFFEHPRS